MFGGRYNRLTFWIWSVLLLIPFDLFAQLLEATEKDPKLASLSLFFNLSLLIVVIIWINALANRIRDYGSNPWIAAFATLPLVNIGLALYYGIVQYKNKPIKNNANANINPSLLKAVHDHSKDMANDIKPTINEYKEKHQTNKSNASNILSMDDNAIYEKVMIEIEEDNKVKSTWAKALAQSDGDDKKAKSIYINLRVKDIQKEQQKQIEIIRNQEKQTRLALLGGKELSKKEKDFLKKYNVDIFSENVNINSSSIIIKTPFGDKKFVRG